MDVFPQACATISEALLSRSLRCYSVTRGKTGPSVSPRLAAAVLYHVAGWRPMVGNGSNERHCRSWKRSLRRGSAAAHSWNCGGHGCLSLVNAVCCQGRSLVRRNIIEFGVCGYDREASIMRRPWPTGVCCAMGEIDR